MVLWVLYPNLHMYVFFHLSGTVSKKEHKRDGLVQVIFICASELKYGACFKKGKEILTTCPLPTFTVFAF